ncbi:hypothetical protein [Arthrobacter sp. MMS18-M83]|uniref:hypothetical protein n=1 Tax=Arthrobacter sp. MMS18-M83 TaxID=2996261 RepID=UPI00227CDECF|nr:hypothetical protein [Arthrobacter sp. MMS18-M83]WAH96812.1 hypothetical protein OW521_20980 [Arthrobacter sp. MMS18-M83]
MGVHGVDVVAAVHHRDEHAIAALDHEGRDVGIHRTVDGEREAGHPVDKADQVVESVRNRHIGGGGPERGGHTIGGQIQLGARHEARCRSRRHGGGRRNRPWNEREPTSARAFEGKLDQLIGHGEFDVVASSGGERQDRPGHLPCGRSVAHGEVAAVDRREPERDPGQTESLGELVCVDDP